MESLNDDCLIIIFELVEFTDQLALAQASRRFKSVLQDYIWAHEHRHVYLDFYDFVMDLERFQACATYLLPCAEVVTLENITEEFFRVLIGHCFPNVNELTFLTVSLFVDDQFMITLSGIFPNLKTLRPQAHIEGECLVHFEKVENLILHNCTGVEFRHFITAIRILKLKTLELGIFDMGVPPLGENLRHLDQIERLVVNNHELAWLFEPNAATVFTHLYDIIVYEDMTYEQMRRLFEFVSVLRSGCTSYLEFCCCQNVRVILRQSFFSFYALIKKMFFFMMHGIAHLRISRDIRTLFPTLRKIYFYQCMFRRVNEVLKLLESDVELLNIEECTTYFKILRVPIERIEMNRQRPITLNFHRNFFRKSQYGEAFPVILQYEETALFKVTKIETIYEPCGAVRIFFTLH